MTGFNLQHREGKSSRSVKDSFGWCTRWRALFAESRRAMTDSARAGGGEYRRPAKGTPVVPRDFCGTLRCLSMLSWACLCNGGSAEVCDTQQIKDFRLVNSLIETVVTTPPLLQRDACAF